MRNASSPYGSVHGMGIQSDPRFSAVSHSIDELAVSIHALNQLPSDDDYVFDACRIAALVYEISIARRVPFQQAAEMVGAEGIRNMPVQSLVFALQHTDLSSCWDNMCGVLLWIALVGSAASADSQDKSWLLSIAMRCCIVLLVERGDAVAETMRTMLEVTSLWADGGAAAPASASGSV